MAAGGTKRRGKRTNQGAKKARGGRTEQAEDRGREGGETAPEGAQGRGGKKEGNPERVNEFGGLCGVGRLTGGVVRHFPFGTSDRKKQKG